MASGVFAAAPSLEEARRLSEHYSAVPVTHRFLNDTETPVSAFLKLREPHGSFLLESAEKDKRLGRYSFLGLSVRESLTLEEDTVTVTRGRGTAGGGAA